MSQVSLETLVRGIHTSGMRCALAITGGGSRAVADLLQVPGGSASVVEGVVPYSAEALESYLRVCPEQFCSVRTARAMAMTAYQRARQFVRDDAPSIGLGLTASLISDRPKRGSHRVHVAMQTAARTMTHSLELAKGTRDRLGEETLAAQMALNLLAKGCGLGDQLPMVLHPGERLIADACEASEAWQGLLAGRVAAVLQHERRGVEKTPSEGAVVFPGAFNPLHMGHGQMAEVASQLLGRRVEYEISIFNVDKAPLDFIELRDRAAQFSKESRLWYTSAERFVDKARLFPRATFVVGVDTMARVGDPRYYAGDTDQRDEAVRQMAGQGTRFLVFGRADDGHFRTLDDLEDLPERLRALCDAVPEQDFREDISSTALRQAEPDDD